MPCRCNDYEYSAKAHRVAGSAAQYELTKLEQELCRARAIIHRVLQADLRVSAELKKKMQAEVALLTAHKRAEWDKDVTRQEDAVRDAFDRVEAVKKLGGLPAPEQLTAVAEASRRLAEMRAVTDAELLG